MRNVVVKDMVKSYGRMLAVDRVSFEVREGEMLTLLGPSGCGKSTTLRCIAGLERHESGEIWIGDKLVSAPQRHIFVPPEKRGIGMVFQSYAVWPHMTVFDNVAYPLRVRKFPKSQIKDKVLNTLRLVGLEG